MLSVSLDCTFLIASLVVEWDRATLRPQSSMCYFHKVIKLNLRKNIFRKFIFVIFISYLERPSTIMINVTSSGNISITWTLPVTSSDVIQQTEVRLYHRDTYMVYKRVVNSHNTSLIIRSHIMMSCNMYTLKLRCKYEKVGWSQYQEEKFWATGMLHLILSCSWSI
jgi:hypothetical protein